MTYPERKDRVIQGKKTTSIISLIDSPYQNNEVIKWQLLHVSQCKIPNDSNDIVCISSPWWPYTVYTLQIKMIYDIMSSWLYQVSSKKVIGFDKPASTLRNINLTADGIENRLNWNFVHKWVSSAKLHMVYHLESQLSNKLSSGHEIKFWIPEKQLFAWSRHVQKRRPSPSWKCYFDILWLW